MAAVPRILCIFPLLRKFGSLRKIFLSIGLGKYSPSGVYSVPLQRPPKKVGLKGDKKSVFWLINISKICRFLLGTQNSESESDKYKDNLRVIGKWFLKYH